MKKNGLERSLLPISYERRVNKGRLLKLANETSSSSKVKDEESAIAAEPMSTAAPAQQLAIKAARPTQRKRDIVIREPLPQ